MTSTPTIRRMGYRTRWRGGPRKRIAGVLGPYLPGTPYFAGSVSKRLISGFAGAAVRLLRVSDNAEQDFSFQSGSDTLNLETIQTWAAGSELAVKTVYDQAGSARVLTQLVQTNMPRFNPDGDNGFAVIANDSTAAVNNNTLRGLSMSDIAVDRRICSIFQTERAYFSANRNFFELSTPASNATDLNARCSSTGILVFGGTLPNGAAVRSQVETHSIVSSATGVDARISDKSYLGLAPLTSKVSTGFNIARSVSDSTKIPASDIYATVIYNEVRADAAAIHALLSSMFQETPFRATRILFEGDSLTAGYGGSLGRNTTWRTDHFLDPRVDIVNTGLYGFRYASSAAGVAQRIGVIARPGDLVAVRLGTNDILADSATGPTVLTRLQTWLSSLRTVYSGKVVVCTVPPTVSSSMDATKEAYRLDFNSLLRTNAVSMNVFVAGNDTDAAFTSACLSADPLYTAGVHYTAEGYKRIAELEFPGIQAALAA